MKALAFLGLLILSLPSFGSDFYEVKESSTYNKQIFEVNDSRGELHKIAAHTYSNQNDRLVFMAHGYGDNCAYLKPMIRWFLNEKYDVLCMELPGHGESTGTKADISHIEAYADIYKSIFPKIATYNYASMIFFAHSTGNTGMIEFLLDNQQHQFKKIIMVAPLVRSYLWELSLFGHNVFGHFLSKLPRRPSMIKNAEFKELKKQDPSPIKKVPTHWFQQLVDWNKKLETDGRQSAAEVEVIFGTKDTVIDYEFNESFIKSRFSNAHVQTIKGSDHLIFWEEEPYPTQLFEMLKQALK
ncbi:alpha/beta hydrolase [Peredibacter starrii]|uniref:Alpha/beta hydrolase n=1 Tax=Peredibacter starrii TaxID=28202 RepID=A0AAX4HTG0_9BACT|nr:alpha/beta fold hydrolase [Peredibacter starrii]WPU66286.1 alpha/beta hydrolase [Peredibacter starrii]